MPIDNADNAANDYMEYRETVEEQEVAIGFNDFIGQTDAPQNAVNKTTEIANPGKTPDISIILKSTAENIAEIPPQAIAGPIDLANEILQIGESIGEALTDMGLPSSFLQVINPEGEFDVRFLSPDEKEAAEISGALTVPQIPNFPQPDTSTGTFVRASTEFLAGMIPAVRGTKVMLGTAGLKTSVTEAAAGSAIASAIALDPHEDRLSTYLNTIPILSEIVPDYLADNNPDNESEWEGRLKNAVEDAGIGAFAEGLIRTFKFYKKSRQAKKEQADPLSREELKQQAREDAVTNAPEVPAESFALLGDPGSDKLFTKRLKDAEGRVAAGAVSKDEIFINMARIDTPDDVKNLIQDVANADARAINRKRGGARQTLGQMIEDSDQEFLDIKDLIGRDPGPMTAAQAIASRKILVASGEQLSVLAQKADLPNATDADLVAFRRGMAVHYAIQSEVVAARTETARALRSWGITAGTDKERGQAVVELLENSGGAKSARDMARTIASMGDDLAAINMQARDLMRARRFDAVYQFWVNNILSGPHTHMVNILSNSLTATMSIPETMVNAAISKTFYKGEISYLEATSRAFGLVKGIRDGVRLVSKGNKAEGLEGLSTQFEEFSKIEGLPGNLITADIFGAQSKSKLGAGIDYIGRAMNLPTTALQTEDKFFKAIGYRMELNNLAMRQGLSEGLEREALATRINDIVNNPPANLKADALEVAHYQTFTDPLIEGTIKGKVGQIGRDFRSVPGLRYIAPFVRTPTNILSYTLERTPLALISRSIRADIAAGGVRAAQAWGRITTGSMILLTIADMSMEGTITGAGPKDPTLLSNLKATGWRPFSVKTQDGTFIPYNRLDPVGSLVAFGAMYGEMVNNMGEEDADFTLTAGLVGFSEVLSSKTYLSGVFGFIGAIDPANFRNTPEKVIQNIVSGFVPFSGLVSTVEKVVDPEIRIPESTEGFLRETLDRVSSRIPGFSSTLPLRRDLWGKRITKASGYGIAWDLLSPIYASASNPDAVEKIIINNKIPITHVPKTIREVKLTGEELSEFQRISGESLKEDLNKLVKNPAFKKLTDGPEGGKATVIVAKVRQHREVARLKMIAASTRLQNRIVENEMEKRRKLTENPVADPTPGTSALPMQRDDQSNQTLQDQLSGK